MNRALNSRPLCTTCLKHCKRLPLSSASVPSQRVLGQSAVTGIVNQRLISTSVPLQRVKRKQSTYRPKVPPFHKYGATHRLLRGANVTGERYGPLFDKPDYTFLDGRPTPLTPEQMKEHAARKVIAKDVMMYLQDMENVKSYNVQNMRDNETIKEQLSARRLKTKG